MFIFLSVQYKWSTDTTTNCAKLKLPLNLSISFHSRQPTNKQDFYGDKDIMRMKRIHFRKQKSIGHAAFLASIPSCLSHVIGYIILLHLKLFETCKLQRCYHFLGKSTEFWWMAVNSASRLQTRLTAYVTIGGPTLGLHHEKTAPQSEGQLCMS